MPTFTLLPRLAHKYIHLQKTKSLNQRILNMHDKDYSFAPTGTVAPGMPVAEAVPSNPPDAYNDDEADNTPSDTAIMVGCGILGWLVA